MRRTWVLGAAATVVVLAGCGEETTVTETVAGPTLTEQAPEPEPVVSVETMVETMVKTETVTETVEIAPAAEDVAVTGANEEAPAVEAAGEGASGDAKLGQPVKDGNFTFTVRRIRFANQLPISYSEPARPAQGAVFLVATVRSRNDGKEALTPLCGDADARIEDSEGRLYDVDGDTTISYSDADDAFCSDVQPGFAVATRLVFQIPRDAKPVALQISDDSDDNDPFGDTSARVRLVR